MKTFITLLILSQSFLNVRAQERNPDVHSCRADDEIRKQMIAYKDKSETGCGVVWDFSNLDVLADNYVVAYSSVADKENTIAGTEHRTRYYYTERGDSLLRTGYENNTTLIIYDRPEAVLHFPIVFGDSISGVFHGYGTYSERVMARVFGLYNVTADAAGTLVLPDGNILSNVVRVHNKKTVDWHIFKDMRTEQELKHYIDSVVPFNADSIMNNIDRGMTVLEIDKYSWYAAGYRYPVIETTAINNKAGSPVFMTAFYTPVSEQEYLNDEDNRLIREENGKEPDDNGGINNSPGDDTLFHYKVNTDGYNLNIEYNIDNDATIRMLVCDITGVVYRSRTVSGLSGDSGYVTIDCNGLRRGDYVLYIGVNNKTYSHKIAF